jgi:predicted nucleic acid-binding protein
MGPLFWDTSAFVSLVFVEPKSDLAKRSLAEAETHHAWDWMAVEAKSALGRRSASAKHHDLLDARLALMHWHTLPSELLGQVIEKNRDWKLRAADAGHLFCFQQLYLADRKFRLISFDEEMRQAAKSNSLAVL